MSVYRKIMSRISEPYRIAHGYGLSPIRTRREAKAVYKFCLRYIRDRAYFEVAFDGDYSKSPTMEVVKNTIALYHGEGVVCHCPNCAKGYRHYRYGNYYDYVVRHSGWYWD